MLVRIANREDPDQTASSEAVRSGSVLFVLTIFVGPHCLFEILEHILWIMKKISLDLGPSKNGLVTDIQVMYILEIRCLGCPFKTDLCWR